MSNKVAVVTGGAKGIGLSIARRLAKDGFDIVLNYRTPRNIEEIISELSSYGVTVKAYQCDVSVFDSVESFIKEVMNDFGRIDVLVNNAGITKDNLLQRMKEEDFDQVIDVNLKGAFNTTKQVYRTMLKQKYGRIINISSVVGLIGNIGQSNYSASKAGLIGFTKSIAREMAHKGVTVNAVCPGFIETEMTDAIPEQAKKALLSTIPMKRMAKVEEVANVVSFLAGDEATYITGQAISVDGGMAI